MTAKKPDAMANLQARADAALAAAAARGQTNLFDSVEAPRPSAIEPTPAELATVAPERAGKREKLLPVRHVERDFFLCDMFDYAMKDDGASMEAPIFTLATRPDLTVWNWQSKDGNRALTVTPSVLGRATMFDKDVLIYVISQMTEALNCDREDAKNRTVRFVVYDYLVSTNKPTGGKEYQRLESTLERLRGTSIKTDIKTGGTRVKEGFGLIDSWAIVEKSPDNERMIAVEITLSKWLFNAVQAHEVLTIHRNYFRLRKPLEKRLYELARKHCGSQSSWSRGSRCNGTENRVKDLTCQVRVIDVDSRASGNAEIGPKLTSLRLPA